MTLYAIFSQIGTTRVGCRGKIIDDGIYMTRVSRLLRNFVESSNLTSSPKNFSKYVRHAFVFYSNATTDLNEKINHCANEPCTHKKASCVQIAIVMNKMHRKRNKTQALIIMLHLQNLLPV